MEKMIKVVEDWARVRKLHNADPKAQALKVVEEFTEMMTSVRRVDVVDGIGDTYVTLIILCQQLGIPTFPQARLTELAVKSTSEHAKNDQVALMAMNMLATSVSKGDQDKIQSAIIAIKTIADLAADEVGATPYECLSIAYNEIKDRKGMLIDGTFVKYDDLSDEDKAMLDRE